MSNPHSVVPNQDSEAVRRDLAQYWLGDAYVLDDPSTDDLREAYARGELLELPQQPPSGDAQLVLDGVREVVRERSGLSPWGVSLDDTAARLAALDRTLMAAARRGDADAARVITDERALWAAGRVPRLP